MVKKGSSHGEHMGIQRGVRTQHPVDKMGGMARSSPSSPKKNLLALRQLALTAPAATAALPEVFALLRGMVGCETISIYWHDAGFNITNIVHAESAPLAVQADFIENFAPHEELQRVAGMLPRAVYQTGEGTYRSSASPHFDVQALKHSEFYNRILRPIGNGWGAGLLCRGQDGGPLGGIGMGRALHARDFNAREMQSLREAQPWVQHLLRRDAISPDDGAFVSSGESASLLLDATGKLLSASAGGLDLLHLAAGTTLTGALLRKSAQGDVQSLLRSFVQPLLRLPQEPLAAPPSRTLHNAWGRFCLRAYVLHGADGGAQPQISLHIERQVPLALRLFRAPRFLELSPRERETCLHLLAGRSHTGVAQAMGVKPATAIYFTRQIYQKMEIQRQAELLPALLA